MNKGERISKFVRELEGDNVDLGGEVANHPFYRAYFRCWNEQRYYEAHDVLEQLWLNNDTADDNFFKGLIQAAGAFVHLQKNRLRPAVSLFNLAEKNLKKYPAFHEHLDVACVLALIRAWRDKLQTTDFAHNPLTDTNAPRLSVPG